MTAARSPWHAAVGVDPGCRGFDDDGPHWLHPRTWQEPDVSGAVSATLTAISSHAGWAALFDFDRADERDRAILAAVVDDIDAGLEALRSALRHDTSTKTIADRRANDGRD